MVSRGQFELSYSVFNECCGGILCFSLYVVLFLSLGPVAFYPIPFVRMRYLQKLDELNIIFSIFVAFRDVPRFSSG